MPNVVGSLFSLEASGKFGGALDFMCGKAVRKAKGKPKKNKGTEDLENNTVTVAQAAQRQNFQNGVRYWKEDISQAVRDEWKAFGVLAVTSGKCASNWFRLSGYTCWMKFYMKYGEDGWPGFPSPPEDWMPE